MMKVLEQATKVHCFAEEVCDETAKGDWQPCAYQLYRWQMDQEVGHLYALFGGPEEDEVRVKDQRLAKTWMDKAIDSVERARKHVGLRDRAWRRGPRRVKELCGGLPGGAGEPDEDSAPAEAPDGGSEFSPGSSDSDSDTDCFESCDPRYPDPEEDPESSGAESEKPSPLEARSESSELSKSESSEAESEDSDSSEAESEESDPFDMEARRRGPLTSSSSHSDFSSASSDSEDSDSSSANSGFAKSSSSDTETDFTPSAPSLEETEEFGRKVIGLSGRARWQVRKLLAVLARMRKDLPPSARIEAVRRLGWRLRPGLEANRASAGESGPELTRTPEGGDQIMKFLEEWQRKYKESEERYRNERDKAFRADDEVAHAEERLAAERTAELEKGTKMVEQRLPAVTARQHTVGRGDRFQSTCAIRDSADINGDRDER